MKQPRKHQNWQSSRCDIYCVLLLRLKLVTRLIILNDSCYGHVIPSWHTWLVSVFRMSASRLCLQSVVWMARLTPAHVQQTLQESLWIIRADARQWVLEKVSQQMFVYSKSDVPVCVISMVDFAHGEFPKDFLGTVCSCSRLWTKAKTIVIWNELSNWTVEGMRDWNDQEITSNVLLCN